MAITKNAAPLLEEGEVVEDADSIASSREASLKDVPIDAGLPQTAAPAPSVSRNTRFSDDPGTGGGTKAAQDAVAEIKHSHRISDMSEGDLERAKTLVLDLLGWGVPPEYLVEHGVSPEVIYKIFTDLNLRLPRNLPQAPCKQS